MAPGAQMEIETVAVEGDTRREGWLTEADVKTIKTDHILEAMQALRSGSASHRFAASTHYDVVLDDGTRLAPKAVFGVAASRALGRDVGPGDFNGGDKTACFRTIEAAGLTIKRKEASGQAPKKRGGRPSGRKPGGRTGASGGSIPPTHANLEDARATAPLTRWLIHAARFRQAPRR